MNLSVERPFLGFRVVVCLGQSLTWNLKRSPALDDYYRGSSIHDILDLDSLYITIIQKYTPKPFRYRCSLYLVGHVRLDKCAEIVLFSGLNAFGFFGHSQIFGLSCSPSNNIMYSSGCIFVISCAVCQVIIGRVTDLKSGMCISFFCP